MTPEVIGTSTPVIVGVVAAIAAQVATLLAIIIKARISSREAAQQRKWDQEDRAAAEARAIALTGHVQAATARLSAAIADNTTKTEGAATAAREAFHEANNMNEKIASLGLRGLDGSLRLIGPAERVLVVEDNPVSLKLARLVLLGAGYLVDTVTSAEDALEELAVKGRLLPDLILVDLNLPRMDGCALARTLRGRGFTMPMLALTGFAVEPQRCYDAGFDGFIEKSGDTDMLPRIIAQHLRLTRLQQQHQEPIPPPETPAA